MATLDEAVVELHRHIAIAESLPTRPMLVMEQGELSGYVFSTDDGSIVLDHTKAIVTEADGCANMSFDAYDINDVINGPTIKADWNAERQAFEVSHTFSDIRYVTYCVNAIELRRAIFRFARKAGA